jgi:hypothetical protein
MKTALIALLALGMYLPAMGAGGGELVPKAADAFFIDEVWAKVGERTCLKCHNAGGDASESKFLMQDTSRDLNGLSKNLAVFLQMAAKRKEGKSRLLVKPTGGLKHEGGVVLKPGSSGYRILEEFVDRLSEFQGKKDLLAGYHQPPFFDGLTMMTPDRLLRRVTLSLAARLPTEEEHAALNRRGLGALDSILDELMKEDAFYERLLEGFNDVFLTQGYDGNSELVLSYDHFNKTRNWFQKHDLNHVPEKERQKARYKLAGDYRQALRREPLELIKYIVRNDRPITELVTADYIMVSPYSARGYGIYEQVRGKFKNPDDHLEYIRTQLPALKARSGKIQKSETGRYPHSGLLSTFQYLRRYPTTDTNRNRLRARMYYQFFLGVDILELASRVNDAAAISAKFDNPTMQAADCVVCHRVIDPVAGLFQDFNAKGHLGPRKEGWYKDVFGPGLEGEDLPGKEQWRALQWLGERTAKDPRFTVAMAEHVYYILMGRRVLLPPEDIDDPMFGAKRRAYKQQRRLIEDAAKRCAKTNFNLKVIFKDLIASKFYCVDGLTAVAKNPQRREELDDVGLVRLLAPEQLERKLMALFGQKWGKLVGRESKFKILYGGINSKSVTERMSDPSGAMGAIQRIMANDVACRNVVLDFSRKPRDRLLFPNIEPDVVPGDKPESEAQIRQAIVHLHQHLLGQKHAADHPEIERTYQLFAGIIVEARTTKGLDKRESYHCGRIEGRRLEDPNYTLRAWRGVVTYLLRQYDFLYE